MRARLSPPPIGILAALAVSSAACAEPEGAVPPERPISIPRAVEADALAQSGAEGLCQALAREAFPAFESWFDEHRGKVWASMGLATDSPLIGERLEALPMDLTVGDKLDFVLELPPEVRRSYPSIDLTCTGDLVEGRMRSVRFNGETVYPPAGRTWSF